MALGLHIGTHHTVTHHGLTIFGEEGWNDGVERSLAWRHQIGGVMTIGTHIECMATVLQAHTKCGLYTTRTKAHVIALDKADHHAVFISSTQINRAAFDRITCAKVLGFFHIDQLGAALEVSRVQHLYGRNFHRRSFCHISVNISEGQLHRFNLQVL